jgi:hypothetical protein
MHARQKPNLIIAVPGAASTALAQAVPTVLASSSKSDRPAQENHRTRAVAAPFRTRKKGHVHYLLKQRRK